MRKVNVLIGFIGLTILGTQSATPIGLSAHITNPALDGNFHDDVRLDTSQVSKG